MLGLSEYSERGVLKCKRPFVDGDGNVWLPGDPLQFSMVQVGQPYVFLEGATVALRLMAEDVEQGEVLAQPELYFELPAIEA